MFSINFDNENLDQIYDHYMSLFFQDPLLVKHRAFVENNGYGYGERPFHALWKEIISSFDEKIDFLEIGVYKGQILSLVKLLCNIQNKKNTVVGLSPLNNSGDKYSTYDDVDYGLCVENIFKTFNLDFNFEENLIQGLSTDKKIIEKVLKNNYNLIYVDGGHDYDCVKSDIHLMKKILVSGGIVVFDDSSNHKKFNTGRQNFFMGHMDVSNAIRDNLENDYNFQEIMCVGHNRVFRKK